MGAGTDSARHEVSAPAARVGGLIGIAPEGVALALGLAGLGVVLEILGVRALGAIVVLAALAIAMFFRDPERYPAREDGVILSAADGKVTEVAETAFPGERTRAGLRVSVFMSPLDVHVNRAPARGTVERVEHTPGKFSAAFRDQASEHNERNLIVLGEPGGPQVALVQVAGYLARRIVCRVRAGDRIQPAQRIGLIMFGSRVDHYLPAGYRVTVARGDRVRAGESVIGELS